MLNCVSANKKFRYLLVTPFALLHRLTANQHNKSLAIVIVSILLLSMVVGLVQIPQAKAQTVTNWTTVTSFETSNVTTGFASQGLSGATLSVNTNETYVSNGAQSLRVDNLLNGNYFYQGYTLSSVSTLTIKTDFWINSTILPNTEVDSLLWVGQTYTNFHVNMLRLNDGNYIWQISDSETATNYNSTTFTFIPNTVYNLQLFIRDNSVTGHFILIVNGNQVINQNNINVGSDTINSFRIEFFHAGNSSSPVLTVYFDNVQYSLDDSFTHSTNAQTSNIFGVSEFVWNYLTFQNVVDMKTNGANTLRMAIYTSWWDANLSGPTLTGQIVYMQPQMKLIKQWCNIENISLEIMSMGTEWNPTPNWDTMKADIILNTGGAGDAFIASEITMIQALHPAYMELLNEVGALSDTPYNATYTDAQYFSAYEVFAERAMTAYNNIASNITYISGSAPFWDMHPLAQSPLISPNANSVLYDFHYYYSNEGIIPQNLTYANGDSANFPLWNGNFSQATSLMNYVIMDYMGVQDCLDVGLKVFWEECGTNTQAPHTQEFVNEVKNFTETYNMGLLIHCYYYDPSGILNSDWSSYNVVGQEWFQTIGTMPTPTPTPTNSPNPTGPIQTPLNVIDNIFFASLSGIAMFAVVPIISVAGLIISIVLMTKDGNEVDPKIIVAGVILVIAVNIIAIVGILIINGVHLAMPTTQFLLWFANII